MQALFSGNMITGLFIRELKNRFRCEVRIGNKIEICYVPYSCQLGKFLCLTNREVLLLPTVAKNAKLKYALFAVPYKRNYIVLNSSMANKAIEKALPSRRFSYLRKREHVYREFTFAGYKCDLFIKDTNTIIEVKSIISTEKNALFSSVYSERMMKQLEKMKEILIAEGNVCICVVSVCCKIKIPKVAK